MALVVAIAGLIARQLIPMIRTKQAELDAKLRQTEWAWAADIIDAVVRAVEQTVSEECHGDDKKDLAINYIEIFLKQNGINLTHEEIDALIEAAVHAMNENLITLEAPMEVMVEDSANVKE